MHRHSLAALILALALLLPCLAQAYDVLILMSRRDQTFNEVLKGFRSGHGLSERVVVLSDYVEADITRIVREDQPGLVLAVGNAALVATRNIRQTPVVAVMSFGIHNLHNPPSNLVGIEMLAPPERYLDIFTRLKSRRVGFVYNPAQSGWYLRQAQQAARQADIELVAREIKAGRDTLPQLKSLAGRVDAIWMLPDSTAVTRETTEAYFCFSQEQRVPLISFAEPYLGLGATAVVLIDWVGLGGQAANIAATILQGKDHGASPFVYPQRTTIKSNHNVFKRLGLAADLFGALAGK